ncbi:beta-glucosidase 18-like [Heracleum sosnowskyi]|uniref:Beta-glucosidase 18-like n=1 Tax=Heracleum sosnowskyi TaxID=360622 RepID=A0AAD8JNP4_9APIA|nr:beta-glucosidase 18-like [Heracleum sosnowskyi]
MKEKSTAHLLIIIFLFTVIIHAHLCSSINGVEEEEEIKRSDFPHGFLFGTATSSYQIEGGYLVDGKGLSNWDVFTHTHGNLLHGENGDICDDHYHRYLEDIQILHSLGVDAYRFSISWSRVLPRGRFGEVNLAGIKFYNKIIDNLLVKGIKPFVTLSHHEYPHELQDQYGAWLSPQIKEDFAHFAEICFKSFGDRVKHWMTINEPDLFISMAYIAGLYPPSHCSPPFGNCSVGNSDVEPLIAMHNMVLCHAKAAKLYHEHFQAQQGGSIGIVISGTYYESMTDKKIDKDAACRALAFTIGWVLDPLVFGDYPAEMRQYLGNELPQFSLEEIEYVKGSIDFIGLNHYTTSYSEDCLYSNCTEGADHAIKGYQQIKTDRDGILIGEPTAIDGMSVVPRGMEEIVDYVKERYNNIPMYITENGYSTPQGEDVSVKDILNDTKRIEYHKAYLAYLARAIRNGADVRGYFAWTLLDDFEWIFGYGARFGLYYVDPHTLDRIPKLSAMWYNSFLTKNDSFSREEDAYRDLLQDKYTIAHESLGKKAEI